ncbi:MAG: PorT family protein [Flavobacteriales bacterium]|nr:PorT family protein [Flavobacteriales bacterium]
MRTLTIIASIALGILSAHAQFDLGGKAGLNYHFQDARPGDKAPAGMERPDGDNGLGWHAGLFAEFSLGDRWLLRPEALYSTRLTRREISSTIGMGGTTTAIESDARGTLSYLEVPVLIGRRLGECLTLQAGPAMGLLLGNQVKVTGTQRVTTDGNTVTTSLDATTSSTDGLNAVEFAGVIGLGYRLDNGMDLGLRFWNGFTPLQEDTDIIRTKQRLIQLSVGWAFKRG